MPKVLEFDTVVELPLDADFKEVAGIYASDASVILKDDTDSWEFSVDDEGEYYFRHNAGEWKQIFDIGDSEKEKKAEKTFWAAIAWLG